MREAKISITNCIDCNNSAILPDPDPIDSFNMDDVKLVCSISDNKEITISCRPYNVRRECVIPEFCPLIV